MNQVTAGVERRPRVGPAVGAELAVEVPGLELPGLDGPG